MGRTTSALAIALSAAGLWSAAALADSHDGPADTADVQGRLVQPDSGDPVDDAPPVADPGSPLAEAPPDIDDPVEEPEPVAPLEPEPDLPPGAESGVDVDILMDTLLTALEEMQDLRPKIDALEGQMARHEQLLRLVCTDEGYDASPPDCLHLHPDPPDLSPLERQIETLEKTVLDLQEKLAGLQAVPVPAPSPTPVPEADPDPAPIPQPVTPSEEPFVLQSNDEGLPLFPAQRELDDAIGPLAGVVAKLPDAALCGAAGTWLVDNATNRIADAFYVARNGEIAMCQLVGGSWSVVSAGRLDRAHILIEGDKK